MWLSSHEPLSICVEAGWCGSWSDSTVPSARCAPASLLWHNVPGSYRHLVATLKSAGRKTVGVQIPRRHQYNKGLTKTRHITRSGHCCLMAALAAVGVLRIAPPCEWLFRHTVPSALNRKKCCQPLPGFQISIYFVRPTRCTKSSKRGSERNESRRGSILRYRSPASCAL
jgi:hypothetical protein